MRLTVDPTRISGRAAMVRATASMKLVARRYGGRFTSGWDIGSGDAEYSAVIPDRNLLIVYIATRRRVARRAA